MKAIAVINQKGGVGKTTTAINMAYFMAKNHNLRVLIVDFDPQGNASSGLNVDRSSLRSKDNAEGLPTILDVISGEVALSDAIIKTDFKNLHIVPSTPQLADAEVGLSTLDDRFTRLKQAIATVSDDYDIVIIDSPPSLSLLTLNVLTAVDHVVLPVQAEFYALEGLSQLLETMKVVRQTINAKVDLLGVIITMMDSRTSLSQEVYQEVAKYFPEKVMKTTIPRNIRLAEAPSHGLPVGAYDRFCKGARAYKAATAELLNRLNG